MSCAPVAVFAYRRPDHLRATLESLVACELFDATPLHVFCDGPRDASEVEMVEATRSVARELLGDRAEYHCAEHNQGLSTSIIGGVGNLLERYGRVIVVEDDLVLHEAFLSFMNEALRRYEGAENVYQVSGYLFDIERSAANRSAFFLPLTVSWGWATWQRAWNRFDAAAGGWQSLASDPDLRRRFNLGGAYDYATMLERQMQGRRDSWAIRWYWSVFRQDGLVLFPPVSFVSNIGFDGSGTHGRGRLSRFSVEQSTAAAPIVDFPETVRPDSARFADVCEAVGRQSGGRISRLVSALRRLLNR